MLGHAWPVVRQAVRGSRQGAGESGRRATVRLALPRKDEDEASGSELLAIDIVALRGVAVVAGIGDAAGLGAAFLAAVGIGDAAATVAAVVHAIVVGHAHPA